MQDMIIQGIGVIGTILFLLSYQIKSNRKLLFVQCGGAGMFILQFLLLGGYSGCGALAILCAKNIIISQRGKWRISDSKVTMAILLVLCAVNAVYIRGAWFDIFSFIAVSAGIIGYWGNNARHIRTANLFCACPAWIIYDFMVGSYAGVFNEAITMISILISIYRFGWKNLGENSTEFSEH